MPNRYHELTFTPQVKAVQETLGSRQMLAKAEARPDYHGTLSEHEAEFIATRDSFYLGTVGETGWPYIQHRGGPPGFVKMLGGNTIGFADFRGNKQYITIGNLLSDNRVSLFFMDYPRRGRLKLLGRARVVGVDEAPEIMERLAMPDYPAKVERGFLIDVEAFDWNCSQHITPRFTLDEINTAVAPLRERIAALEAELAEARAGTAK